MVVHLLAQCALERDLIVAAESLIQIAVDLSKLAIHMVRSKVDEFILYITKSEERLHSVLNFHSRVSPRLERILIGEGALSKVKCLVEVHTILGFIHFY